MAKRFVVENQMVVVNRVKSDFVALMRSDPTRLRQRAVCPKKGINRKERPRNSNRAARAEA